MLCDLKNNNNLNIYILVQHPWLSKANVLNHPHTLLVKFQLKACGHLKCKIHIMIAIANSI